MKELNHRKKNEQFFLIMMTFIALGVVLSVCGCGGKNSCEKPACSTGETNGSLKVIGCSIPGCGGCLSYGRGCDSACWPQSCKYIVAYPDKNSDIHEEDHFLGCDIRYYGDGCLGCGQSEKSCYMGYMDTHDEDSPFKGGFYGSTDSEERIFGCLNGCGGCVASDGNGKLILYNLEALTGVD